MRYTRGRAQLCLLGRQAPPGSRQPRQTSTRLGTPWRRKLRQGLADTVWPRGGNHNLHTLLFRKGGACRTLDTLHMDGACWELSTGSFSCLDAYGRHCNRCGELIPAGGHPGYFGCVRLCGQTERWGSGLRAGWGPMGGDARAGCAPRRARWLARGGGERTCEYGTHGEYRTPASQRVIYRKRLS